MSQSRRGFAVLIRGGDAEISGAIAEGMREATTATALMLPTPEDGQRARVVREEIERQRDAEANRAEVVRQRAREAARRVAIRRHTPQEWAAMTTQARFDYGQDPEPGKLARALTAIYGLLCYALAAAYRAQDAVLDPEGRGRG